MTARDLEIFKSVIQGLRLDSKTHFSRQDIDSIVRELEGRREYQLADHIRAMDPASVTALLR